MNLVEENLFIFSKEKAINYKVHFSISKPIKACNEYICKIQTEMKGSKREHEIKALTCFDTLDLSIYTIKSVLWGHSQGDSAKVYYPNSENTGPDLTQPFEIEI